MGVTEISSSQAEIFVRERMRNSSANRLALLSAGSRCSCSSSCC